MATVTNASALGNQTLLAAGQTATQTVNLTGLHAVGNNFAAHYLVLVVNISAFTSGTLTVATSGVSAAAYTNTLLTSAALGAAATTALQMGPSLPATANLSANVVLPSQVQVVATVSGGGSLTYGIDYFLGP